MSSVDIVAVRQPDGTIKSTSFYVSFNSRKASEAVHLEVNGVAISEIEMMAHQSGEIYFSPKLTRRIPPKDEKIENEANAGKMIKEFANTEDIDESEIARDEGKNSKELETYIAEEEKQIREQVAAEDWLLGDKQPSPATSSNYLNTFLNNSNGSNSNSNSSSKNASPSVSRTSSKNGSPSTSRTASPKPDQKGLLSSLHFWGKTKEPTVVLDKVPTPSQLAAMNLKDGENVIKFTTSATKQVAVGKIFLWPNDIKIIVSDIDGTITKTDKRGLFYYKLGYDWTHDNVVDLYKCLASQGYYFVYLTARSMKVQLATRTYLDKIEVPNGPILCAPHNLFSCVTTEFWKTTAEGKLAHLNPLRDLFPKDYNPLVAGFGNKVHDHVCYKAIGIPPERIYIINRSSEVTVNGQKTNYDTLKQISSVLFPPIAKACRALTSSISGDFTTEQQDL